MAKEDVGMRVENGIIMLTGAMPIIMDQKQQLRWDPPIRLQEIYI